MTWTKKAQFTDRKRCEKAEERFVVTAQLRAVSIDIKLDLLCEGE